MIEDEELREIFRGESADHLGKLEEGFLQLERNPGDRELLKSLFREAHSMKGAARMLGVSKVERATHRLEDVLGAANRGETSFTSEVVDRLTRGLDGIRALSEEAVTGVPSGVDVEALAAEIAGALKPAGDPAPASTVPEAPQVPHEEAAGEPPKPESGRELSSGALRVDSGKLDALLAQVGELTVLRNRAGQRLREVEALQEQWERLDQAGRLAESTAREGGEEYAMKRREARLALGDGLGALRRAMQADQQELETGSAALEEGIRDLRLLPWSSLFGQFPRLVRDLARVEEKEVELYLVGEETTADKRLIEEMKAPLTHLIRNAIHHGLEPAAERRAAGKQGAGQLLIQAQREAEQVVLEVEDDGRGLNEEAILQEASKHRHSSGEEHNPEEAADLIFRSGFTTARMVTDVAGRGVGLDVVRESLRGLKGDIEVRSRPGEGVRFRIRLPASLTTERVFLVKASGWYYALPVSSVEAVARVAEESLFTLEGRTSIDFRGAPLRVAGLENLMAPPPWAQRDDGPTEAKRSCLVLATSRGRVGLLVDDLVDELEVLVHPLGGGLLKRVRNVAGITVLGTGETALVLVSADLVRAVKLGQGAPEMSREAEEEPQRAARILLVEDSIATRTQEKRILEAEGYEVTAAVDGVEGWNALVEGRYDAVVSDVEMPNMTGLELTAKIRERETYRDLPIVLVTSLAAQDDIHRGMEAGANAYLTKSTFDQSHLIDTLRRLV